MSVVLRKKGNALCDKLHFKNESFECYRNIPYFLVFYFPAGGRMVVGDFTLEETVVQRLQNVWGKGSAGSPFETLVI